jgi:inward rectifier potassium channel
MSTITSTPTRSLNPDETRDLGFGSVVSSESRQRLLNRDGTFNVERDGLGFFSSLSLYHSLLTMSWRRFFVIVFILYIGANLIFALAYVLCGEGALAYASGDGIPRFLQAFFFSVQTFATIGYGHITPAGLAANIVVTVESLVGLLGFALATGLLFSRFSRPTAKVIFSNTAIMAPYRDMKAFMFRLTNGRTNQIIELEVKVLFARFEVINGKSVRRFYPLELERDKVAFFPLSWTVVHPINDESPLAGMDDADLRAAGGEFLVLLTGIDETFSQTVHARSSYVASEVIWGAKFKDIYLRSPDGTMLRADIRRLHSIERL